MIQYVSTTGLRLLHWHDDLGITDPEDLAWLLEFYHIDRLTSANIIRSAIVCAREFRNR